MNFNILCIGNCVITFLTKPLEGCSKVRKMKPTIVILFLRSNFKIAKVSYLTKIISNWFVTDEFPTECNIRCQENKAF